MKPKRRAMKIIGIFVHFYSVISKEKRAKRRISIILKRKLSKSVIDWEIIEIIRRY